SERQVLQAHGVGQAAARTASKPLGPRRVCDHERPGGRMTLLNRLASIVRWLVGRKNIEEQMNDELQTFVEMSAGQKIRDGVAPAEARRQALLELGGIEQAKERVRTSRHGAWLDELGRDLRYAVR